MNTEKIFTEAQRARAYRQAIGNYAAVAPSIAPAPAPAAPRPAERAAAPAQPPRRVKHEILARLHARSNSGAVKLRDVSWVIDEVTRAAARATG
jgi:hypothetical protein